MGAESDGGVDGGVSVTDEGDDGLSLGEGVLLERIAELERLNAAMHSDWHKLNGFYNRTATSMSWCSEYEERLAQYNSAFEVLKLGGRPVMERRYPTEKCRYCAGGYGECINKVMAPNSPAARWAEVRELVELLDEFDASRRLQIACSERHVGTVCSSVNACDLLAANAGRVVEYLRKERQEDG